MELGMEAISGLCTIIPPTAPPEICTDIRKYHTNLEDMHQIIASHTKESAGQMTMEIYTFLFPDEMLKQDILRIDFVPGGSLPVCSNRQRGMCILNSLPTLATQVAKYQHTKHNNRDMAGTCTFMEAQKKERVSHAYRQTNMKSSKRMSLYMQCTC